MLNRKYRLSKDIQDLKITKEIITENTEERITTICDGILRNKYKNVKYLLLKVAKELTLKKNLFVKDDVFRWVSVDEFIYLNIRDLYKLSRLPNENFYVLSTFDRLVSVQTNERIRMIRLNSQAFNILERCGIHVGEKDPVEG